MKNKLHLILGPMRPPFLLLTPACTLVGLGVALWTKGTVNGWHFLLVLLGTLAAHVSVNAFNEYFDFKNGLDARTQRTPFSGGSGTLQAHPAMASTALVTAWLAFVIAGLTGIYFAAVRGWQLLPLWLIGLLLLYGYTTWAVYHPMACLLAPGLGFGPIMVMGTYFALTGEYSWSAFVASLAPFFLVCNLLLLNQFPDVGADRSVGRRHYPILLGRKASSYLYLAFLAAAYLSVIVPVVLGLLPPLSLLVLLTLAIGLPLVRDVPANAENIPALMPSLARNVLLSLTTPLVLAVSLILC